MPKRSVSLLLPTSLPNKCLRSSCSHSVFSTSENQNLKFHPIARYHSDQTCRVLTYQSSFISCYLEYFGSELLLTEFDYLNLNKSCEDPQDGSQHAFCVLNYYFY